MTEPPLPNDTGCWEKERKYVLAMLTGHDDDIKRIREEQIQTRIFVGVHKDASDMQTEKTKAAALLLAARTAIVYGGITGAVVGLIVGAVMHMLTRSGP